MRVPVFGTPCIGVAKGNIAGRGITKHTAFQRAQ